MPDSWGKNPKGPAALQLKSWNYGHNKTSITRQISKILKKISNDPYYWIDPVTSNAHGKLSIIARLQL